MNVRVNSRAMKSMFTSSVMVLAWPRDIRIKNGSALARYANKSVFIIEPRTSFPTSIPILYTFLNVCLAFSSTASKIADEMETAVSINAPTAPMNSEAIRISEIAISSYIIFKSLNSSPGVFPSCDNSLNIYEMKIEAMYPIRIAKIAERAFLLKPWIKGIVKIVIISTKVRQARIGE